MMVLDRSVRNLAELDGYVKRKPAEIRNTWW
jgi:hypothetical protein